MVEIQRPRAKPAKRSLAIGDFAGAGGVAVKDASYFDGCAEELALVIDTIFVYELSPAATECINPDHWFTSCVAERASCE